MQPSLDLLKEPEPLKSWRRARACPGTHSHPKREAKSLVNPGVLSYHGGESHVKVVSLGEAEVGELHVASRRDEQVLRLQVSMHDAVRVQEVHAAQQLVHDVLHDTTLA